MPLTPESISERIKQLENAISQSLANHNALVGALQEAKSFLTIASDVVNVIAPNSIEATILNEVESIIE